MYQKLSYSFMIIWMLGGAYMAVNREIWPLLVLIPLFFIFWTWGMIRFYRDMKEKFSGGFKKGIIKIAEEKMGKNVILKNESSKVENLKLPENNSFFVGLYGTKDDRFKRE